MAELRRARSGVSTRSRSRSRSRPTGSPPLHRLLSNQFPDDISVYHQEAGEGVHVDVDAASLHQTETERRRASLSSDHSDSSSEEGNNDAIHTEGESKIIVEEAGEGTSGEHDVEAGPATIEKTKSAKSVRDPNLVCI